LNSSGSLVFITQNWKYLHSNQNLKLWIIQSLL